MLHRDSGLMGSNPNLFHRRRGLAAACAAATFLASCASVSVSDLSSMPATPVPAAWSSASVPALPSASESASAPTTPERVVAELTGWWQRFGDDALAALITQALNAGADVDRARASLRQARALRDEAAAGLLPSLGVSASAQQSKQGSSSAANLFQAGFDASWEPDVFGNQRNGLAAADADVRGTLASLGDMQVTVAAEVAVNYIALREAQTRLAIARQNLASQLETLQITQWRLQAGLVTSLDVEQARTAVEQTRAQIPALESTIAQSASALAVLTARTPGDVAGQLATSAPVPLATAGLALSLPAETLRQRPDVRAAEQGIVAAAARVRQADAQRYPSFQIGGTLGVSALTMSALTGANALASALLASVSLPVFDGGAARARVDAQAASLDAARADYRSIVLVALKDVEDALVALRSAAERQATLQRATESAANADLLARQRYQGGVVDFQTVLDTQRSLLSAQDSLAQARADEAVAHVQLYKALGGGWTPSADLQTVGESDPDARAKTPS